jgi:MSHA biogenesis protein MshN
MSLINQVLKDLEKRHAGETEGAARAVRPLPEEGSRRSLWIVAGLIGAGALGGAAWWYVTHAPPTDASSQMAATGNPALAPPAPAVPAPPASIAGTPAASSPGSIGAGEQPASLSSTPSAVNHAPGPPAPPLAAAVDTAMVDTVVTVPEASAGVSPPPVLTPTPPSTAAASLPSAAHTATPEVAAADIAAAPAKPAAKSARKSKAKSAGAAGPAVSGTPGAEYPEPDTAEAQTSIDKQVLPQTDRERAEAELRQAMMALHDGKSAEAEDRLRAALTIDPLSDKARQALLGLYIERGRREDAERLLEDRLRADRKHGGFAMALARLQLERGANGDALITLQRSLPYGETSADYQAMLANALARVGRHREAAERFDAAARLAPRNPLWLMGLGMELRADKRPTEARAAFQRAQEVGGLNAQLAGFVEQQLRELQ